LPDEDYQEVVQTLKGWIAENQAAAQAEAPALEEAPLLEVEQQPEEPEPEEEILQADEPEDEQ